MVAKVFAVQATSRKSSDGDKVYALYEFDRGGKKTELVAGVFDMRVFAVEEKQSAESDFASVKILKIKVLFRSVKDVLANPKPYYFDDMKKDTGGAVHFKHGKIEETVYPKRGDIIVLNQAQGYFHRAEQATIKRRQASFDFVLN